MCSITIIIKIHSASLNLRPHSIGNEEIYTMRETEISTWRTTETWDFSVLRLRGGAPQKCL